MSNDPSEHPPESDAELEWEIRAERKFSLADAIGRMAVPGMMKGASPVTHEQQAEAAIQEFLGHHLPDAAGVLPGVLLRQVGESPLLLGNLDRPLVVLADYVQRILGSEYLLKELVHEADLEWRRVFEERPHFEQEGRLPHPGRPPYCRVGSHRPIPAPREVERGLYVGQARVEDSVAAQPVDAPQIPCCGGEGPPADVVTVDSLITGGWSCFRNASFS